MSDSDFVLCMIATTLDIADFFGRSDPSPARGSAYRSPVLVSFLFTHFSLSIRVCISRLMILVVGAEIVNPPRLSNCFRQIPRLSRPVGWLRPASLDPRMRTNQLREKCDSEYEQSINCSLYNYYHPPQLQRQSCPTTFTRSPNANDLVLPTRATGGTRRWDASWESVGRAIKICGRL
jgi:hypothetical protein